MHRTAERYAVEDVFQGHPELNSFGLVREQLGAQWKQMMTPDYYTLASPEELRVAPEVLTVNMYLDDGSELHQNILGLADEIQGDKNISVLNPDRWHVTLLTDIPISAPLDLVHQIIDQRIAAPILRDGLYFTGIGHGSNRISFSNIVYPNMPLSRLRTGLREGLIAEGVTSKMYPQAWDSIGWIHWPFFTKGKPSLGTIERLERGRHTNYGKGRVSRIELLSITHKTLEGSQQKGVWYV